MKVSFDYFGYLKDKYKRDLDKNDEEVKDKWDDLPIRPALKFNARTGELPTEPEDPYDKKAFVIKRNLDKAPVNYDDMLIPTVANQKRKAAGIVPFIYYLSKNTFYRHL